MASPVLTHPLQTEPARLAPPPTLLRIHPTASPDTVAALAEMLCQAFEHDAHINWIVRQDRLRARAFQDFFRLLLTDLLGSRGELHATADLRAAAIWFPPGVQSLGLLAQARAALRFAAVTGWRRLPIKAYGLNRMTRRHPAQPHYFLQTLGVLPGQQRQGLGSALLRAVLDKCDRAGIPAYLETSNEANLGYYARHGFQVWSTAVLPAGPRLWQLLRPPAADA